LFDLGIRSITQAGVLFLAFLFMVVVFYFVLSGPVDAIFDGFDDVDDPISGDEIDLFLPNIRTAMNIAFALMLATPITGFIMWVFSREPFYERYRRY